MKKLFVVSGLVLAVFIAAFSESSAQTIYSCYNKNSGAMRYVTGPRLCKKTETQISWNTTGPKGDTGATGATGPQGPTGPSGAVAGISQIAYGKVDPYSGKYSDQYGFEETFAANLPNGYNIYFDPEFLLPHVPTCTTSSNDNSVCSVVETHSYYVVVKCSNHQGVVGDHGFHIICVAP